MKVNITKVFLFGLCLFLMSLLCFSLMIAAVVCSGYSIDGSIYFWDVLRVFGLQKLLILFIAFGFVGLILAIIGLIYN